MAEREGAPVFRPVRSKRAFEEIAGQIRSRLATQGLRVSGCLDVPEGTELPDVIDIGLEEHHLTHTADVSSVAVRKREALRHHRSQVADDHWFLAMPEDRFVAAMGTEWFRAHGPVDDEGSPLHGIVTPFTPGG